MSILNRIEKGLKFAVTGTASVTKELMDITKLNAAINAREHEIEHTYTAIGRMLFERENSDPSSPAAALCKKISDNYTAVAEMKAKIECLKSEGKKTRQAYVEEFRKKTANPTVESPTVTEEAAEEGKPVATETTETTETSVSEMPTVTEAVQIVENAGTSDDESKDESKA